MPSWGRWPMRVECFLLFQPSISHLTKRELLQTTMCDNYMYVHISRTIATYSTVLQQRGIQQNTTIYKPQIVIATKGYDNNLRVLRSRLTWNASEKSNNAFLEEMPLDLAARIWRNSWGSTVWKLNETKTQQDYPLPSCVDRHVWCWTTNSQEIHSP